VDDSGKRPKVIVHPDRDNLDKFKVVHGTVTNKWSGDAKPVLHAWVQMGDMIFDDQTKFTKPNGIDKATYYDVFSAEPKNEYTAKQAIANCHTKGIEGPWDAKSMAKMKARDAWLGETRMNKTKLRKIIKEEMQRYLKEFDIPQSPTDKGRKMGQDPTGDETSTLGLEEDLSTKLPLDDLKVVIDALGSQIERVRKIGMEAKKRSPVEHIGTSNTLLWIAGKCADAAWKMSQAKKDLSDAATQRREDRLALESQLGEAGPPSDQERHYQRANAHAANEIEDFISNRLIKLAGPVEQWTTEHLETFEQINNLLNVLFPSGK
jgi:hypothetical protein